MTHLEQLQAVDVGDTVCVLLVPWSTQAIVGTVCAIASHEAHGGPYIEIASYYSRIRLRLADVAQPDLPVVWRAHESAPDPEGDEPQLLDGAGVL